MPRPVVIVDPSFRGQLRRLREERGWSYRDLGRAANYSHTLLWEVETGRKRPTREMTARLDDVLSSGGVLSRLLTVPALAGSLTAEDDARLAYLARHPRRVDDEAVQILSTLLADQRLREDTIGSTPLIAPVNDQLGQLIEVVRETAGPRRCQVVDLAAQWAQFAGWLNISVGRPAVAESWLDRAVVWAIEANNSDMASTALSFKGHLAWTLGDVGPMVSLTEAAQQFAGVYPGEMAYDALQAARGHAAAGDRAEVESQVAKARDLEALAQECDRDVPPWHYYRDAAFFALERGRVFRYLAAQGVDGSSRRAIDELTAGLAALPPGPAHAARYLCDLAVAYALDGDLREARGVLDDVDRIATTTGSTQLTQAVTRLRRQFG